MLVGTYGTLRSGKGLHGALGSSTFMGFYRTSEYNTVLLRTPAGYPAYVQVDDHYLESLHRENEEWQHEMGLTDQQGDAIRERTGWRSGFDVPLLEVYHVNNSTLERLDIVEGVPHLYTRRNVGMIPVNADTITRVPGRKSWYKIMESAAELVNPKMRLSEAGLRSMQIPNRCAVYVMQPTSDWLQGCSIIWNGDFCNPLEREGLVFNYNEFRREQEQRRNTTRARGRPRVVPANMWYDLSNEVDTQGQPDFLVDDV